jgi:hypothetical protein
LFSLTGGFWDGQRRQIDKYQTKHICLKRNFAK